MLRLRIAFLSALLVTCTAQHSTGGVRFNSNVPDAVLYIDDELRGPLDQLDGEYVQLEPGAHHLRLEHEHHRPQSVELVVAPNVSVTVTLDLRRRRTNDDESSSGQGED